MAQQPTQRDIDELMAALGGNYPRDEVVQVARDLGMLPEPQPAKPQAVLGSMVTHPLPPPVLEVPVLEEAVKAAPVEHADPINYRSMVAPALTQQSRWRKCGTALKNAGVYVGKAIAKGTVAGAKKASTVYQRQTPRRKILFAAATAAVIGVVGYVAWKSWETETATDGKTAYATLSYNGTDWAIPKDAAKQVEQFMDGSFAKGDTFQTIESKLLAADLADKTKDNKIGAAGLKYLK